MVRGPLPVPPCTNGNEPGVKRVLVNYLVFQAGWFTCVSSAAAGLPWLGTLFIVCAAGLHLLLARRSSREAALLLACALTGLVFDSALLHTGWVSYPNGDWLPGFAPYWMIALWVLFGTTLNLSMAWLRDRPWVALLFGAIGGPMSYLAGQGLGAMTLLQPVAAMMALAIGWGLALPMLCRLASRLNGFVPPQLPDFVQANWRENRVSRHV